MTPTNFPVCLKHVLKHEGGYVNHPRDPGGATNQGVIQRTYNSYRRRKRLPIRSVRKITKTEVGEIYKQQYWDKVRGDDLPSGVDNCVFDYAVNSGVGRASKELQRIVKSNVDGVVGLNTLVAVDGHSSARLINTMCDRRMSFLRNLRHWKTFGKGWTRRVKDVRSTSLRMASDMPAPPDVPASEDQSDTSSDPDLAPQPKQGFRRGAPRNSHVNLRKEMTCPYSG